LCKIAKERALGMKTSTYNFLPIEYNVSYFETKCDSFSDVDPFKVVETWYEKGKSYDYKHGSSDRSAGKFNVLHKVCINWIYKLLHFIVYVEDVL